MTHNDFDFYEDLIRPLMKFLVQANILQSLEETDSDDDSGEPLDESDNDHAKSEIHKIKQKKNMSNFDLTMNKGYECLDQLSTTQRL